MTGCIKNSAWASVLLLVAAAMPALAGETSYAGVDASDTVVLGKLRLLKNGEEVALGRGLLANEANLNFVELADRKRTSVKVDEDGEFVSHLAPGQYRLAGIEFMVRGERVNAQGNFVLTVTDAPATYVGTITLETSFEMGFYGLAGAVDSYSIADDCAADCAPMLTRLGMPKDAATVALLRPNLELLTRQ